MQYMRGDKPKSALRLTRLNGYGVKYSQNSFAGILAALSNPYFITSSRRADRGDSR